MPTLPIAKTVNPRQETGGGQHRLSLPRLRLSVQSALGVDRADVCPPGTERINGGYGLGLRWKSLAGLPGDPGGRSTASLALRTARKSLAGLPGDPGPALPPETAAGPALLPSPVAFAREVLGVELWGRQVEVLNALTEHRRVAVKAGNGLGKGFCAAVAVLWFMHVHQEAAIALSTAPTFRQVRHILWRQLRRLYRPAAGTLGGKMLDTRWELSDNRYAMGLSADSADQFQGFHSPNVFIVVDEAEGVGEEIYEAIESVMTSADPLLLLIGNPTTMTGAFRRAFYEERQIYRTITISALDSPNAQAGRVVIPGLTTPRWIEERKQIWGEENPVYRSRVLGEFPEQGEDTLISLSDIEAAVRRFEGQPGKAGAAVAGPDPAEGLSIHPSTGSGQTGADGANTGAADPGTDADAAGAGAGDAAVILAVDVARFGADRSVILRRRGNCVEDIRALRQMDTMQLTGWVSAAIRECSPAQVCVDEIGVGAGVVDRLRELGHPVRGVNVAHKARQDGIFVNLRAEGYWTLRERFVSGRISIPADNQLVGELAALRYGYDSQGRIKMESKDDMRQRGLPSPDKADALMLAFLAPANRLRLWT